ncbi:Lactadherin [Exaiptasia diaphana]|nr:Lactadherin [Exaiptasia diaphana]
MASKRRNNTNTSCTSPLGMQDGTIKDNQITASSSYSSIHAPKNGRLHKQNAPGVGYGAWSALNRRINDEYIQVDLGMEKVITMVATQGRQDCCAQFVTKYSLSYSNDASNWKSYTEDCTKIFPGNSDRDTVVKHELEVPIKTRHIRLIVKEFNEHPSLRMELYGCTFK